MDEVVTGVADDESLSSYTFHGKSSLFRPQVPQMSDCGHLISPDKGKFFAGQKIHDVSVNEPEI